MPRKLGERLCPVECVHVRRPGVDAAGHHEGDVHGEGPEEALEETEVPGADALARPGTVVVQPVHAHVALVAVAGRAGAPQVALAALEHGHLGGDLRLLLVGGLRGRGEDDAGVGAGRGQKDRDENTQRDRTDGDHDRGEGGGDLDEEEDRGHDDEQVGAQHARPVGAHERVQREEGVLPAEEQHAVPDQQRSSVEDVVQLPLVLLGHPPRAEEAPSVALVHRRRSLRRPGQWEGRRPAIRGEPHRPMSRID